MNPMPRQHAIREYELFVSGGVQEIPDSVYEREPRAAGEYKVLRGPQAEALPAVTEYSGTTLTEATIDLDTGELIED